MHLVALVADRAEVPRSYHEGFDSDLYACKCCIQHYHSSFEIRSAITLQWPHGHITELFQKNGFRAILRLQPHLFMVLKKTNTGVPAQNRIIAAHGPQALRFLE
jgi:hypothetical protein